MITCPKCNSQQIVRQRVDSDWHNNPATQVNEDSCYTPYELKRINDARIQIDLEALICIDCDHKWDVS